MTTQLYSKLSSKSFLTTTRTRKGPNPSQNDGGSDDDDEYSVKEKNENAVDNTIYAWSVPAASHTVPPYSKRRYNGTDEERLLNAERKDLEDAEATLKAEGFCLSDVEESKHLGRAILA